MCGITGFIEFARQTPKDSGLAFVEGMVPSIRDRSHRNWQYPLWCVLMLQTWVGNSD